jgi:hypothetical protein
MIEKQNININTYVGLDVVRKISVERILSTVCSHLKVDSEEIKGRSRVRKIADARHIFCYLAYHSSDNPTLKEIGNLISKDHASVLHGKNKIVDLVTTDRRTNETIEALRVKLGRFSDDDVENKKITQAHVGWYNSKERKDALKLYCENHDVVTMMKMN